MSEVYITRIAKFLPNEAVDNSELEEYLGTINGKPSKSKAIVLRNNGIKSRYYALTKEGISTHTNAEMAAQSVRALFDHDPEQLETIDLLACATSSPDQLMPSHAVMVHGELPETGAIEVVSPSGVCCAGMHAFKYAWMSVKLGEKKRAVCSASERLTPVLRSDQFEDEVSKLASLEKNPVIAFEKDFLRWMLSDGAGAFFLEAAPNAEGISLRVEWLEAASFANTLEPCMYMGSEKRPDGTLQSYKDFAAQELAEQSVLSIKQDVKLLGNNIVQLGVDRMVEVLREKGIGPDDIDYFLPHLSSYFFESKIADYLKEKEYELAESKWFTNLKTKGNVGAASIYLMLEELFHSGRLTKGERILISVPESSRFSYVYGYLTVV
jgi:3-oxoacyl-[acyl-carrier-protein] synthase-3